MSNHRYTLEPYKGMATKHLCPHCEHKNKFTRYIDTETNLWVHNTVGRCDRVDSCGYHYKPKEYFTDKGFELEKPTKLNFLKPKAFIPEKVNEPSLIPFEVFKRVLGKDLDNNNFVKYLISLFGEDSTQKLVERYFISTSKIWNGATVFWQIDIKKKIRSGKILLYNPISGKRDKTKNSWVHSALKLTDFNLKQCFFGAHLLTDKNKTVAIVESDKTAIIMSHYLPEYIWLSSSGKEGLNADKFKMLQGRTVILFPDLSGRGAKIKCFDLWSSKAKEFKTIARITVSEYLEKIATDDEKLEGLDIADYFIKYPPIKPIVEVKLKIPTLVIPKIEVVAIVKENWKDEIRELEAFFANASLQTQPIKLNPNTTITNVPAFIDSHLATVKGNINNQTHLPYLERLRELKKILISKHIP